VIEPCPNSVAPCSGAATPDISNNSSFTTVATTILQRSSLPYSLTFSASAWTKGLEAPLFGYRTSSRTFGLPIQSTTATTISSGSESAISFNIPSSICGTYKIVGVRAVTTSPTTNKSTRLTLYSGITNLQSVTLDSDINRAYSLSGSDVEDYFANASLSTLNCGTTYRIGYAPQDASNGFALHTLDFATAGDRTAFPGGTMFAFASRSSCGGPCDATSTPWAPDTTTSRPLMELILDDLTPPSGAGSGGSSSYTFVGALRGNPLELVRLAIPGRRVVAGGIR